MLGSFTVLNENAVEFRFPGGGSLTRTADELRDAIARWKSNRRNMEAATYRRGLKLFEDALKALEEK